jgi:predicted ester cyclase
VARDVANHAAVPEHRHGIEGAKHTDRWVRASFPDSRVKIADMIAEGDKVAAYVTLGGTHQGEFRGIPPTSKLFSVEHVHWLRLADGMVVEHWSVRDDLGQMTQLDLIPEPGSSS